MNTGKKFEQLIKQSAEEQGIEYTRFRDAGAMLRSELSKQKRFTPKNICDCLLFNGRSLYYIEAKVGKTSVSFDRLTQHPELMKKAGSPTPGVHAGYLFDIKGRCFYVRAQDIEIIRESTGKKSVNDKDLEGLHGVEIPRVVPPGKRSPRLDLSVLD